jgi:periplasmic divalent cation tolerance protein
VAEATAVLLLVTAGGRDEAERLGEGLVEQRLAACTSVVPVVRSFYWWEGKLQREHEALLLVKTSPDKADVALDYVKQHHSYELPEILRLEITGGSQPYLDWLLREVDVPAATKE